MHNDVDVLLCGCWWYLCSYVALGFGTACSLLYLVENRASCYVLAETVSTVVIPSQVSVRFVKTKHEHVFE